VALACLAGVPLATSDFVYNSCEHPNAFISLESLLVISLAVASLIASIMMGRISSSAVSAAILIKACWAQMEPEIPHMEWPQAIRLQGNLSSQIGISESKQDLFRRQTCPQGYGICSTIAPTSVPYRGAKLNRYR
jgi:hypothetical protein